MKFIENILKKLDLENRLDEKNILRLSKSLNYDKQKLLEIATTIKEKKRFQVKFWINHSNGSIFGKGDLELIVLVDKLGSISAAAKTIGFSYKKAWSKIQQIEKELGQEIFIKQKGAGRQGGTKLNAFGKKFLSQCMLFEEKLNNDTLKNYNLYLKEFFNTKENIYEA